LSEPNAIETARDAYVLVQPFYAKLAPEIQDLLKTKLATAGISPVSLSHRIKTPDSFEAKIGRKQYTDPLSQMTDLAGVRVVCTYASEIENIADIIEAAFEVRERIDKARDLGVDRMGYNGKAYVVRLGAQYAGGRYEGITNIDCEIQVRTVLQDAWATINHQLVYKNEESTPERLRRDLNNVASLLEVAQGIFDSVKVKREAYVSEIQQKQDDQPTFLAQPLDLDTVVAYTRWKFPDLDASESLTQMLLRDIDLQDYPTLHDLDAVVDRAHAAVAAYAEENADWFGTGTDFLTKSLGFVDPKFRAKHGFAPRTRAAFDTYQNLVAK
jgi:ppGpp synthetase/RelA/SpoT-type nucleotidyltranferase